MTSQLPDASEERFWSGVRDAARFFMGTADVQRALEKLARVLDDLRIPYAIIDAMALNEFGYQRTTVDVDVLLTAEGLATFKRAMLGRGYVEKVAGSRSLRDTEHNVDIDVVLTGDYPGDVSRSRSRFPTRRPPRSGARASPCSRWHDCSSSSLPQA